MVTAERTRLRIRGIYSTALTDIFLERGFAIVPPSVAISQRFAIVPAPGEEHVTIYDRRDKQGIVLEGERDKMALAEFYHDGIRYVDLEVDVVRWPDGTVRTIDREHLERGVADGVVGRRLASRALAIAAELECRLRDTVKRHG